MNCRSQTLLPLLICFSLTCSSSLQANSTDEAAANEVDNDVHDDGDVVDLVELKDFSSKLIAYVKSWDDTDFTNIIGSSITHGIFAFADVHSDGSVSIPSDRLPKLIQMLYSRSELQLVGHSLNVLVSIGGSDNSQHFSRYTRDDSSDVLVRSVTDLINEFNLDGVEVDWQEVEAGDKENYVRFVRKLRTHMDQLRTKRNRASNYILTITTPVDEKQLEDAFDLPELSKSVDWFNLMTHDFNYFKESDGKSFLGSPVFSPLGSKLSIHATVRRHFCSLTKSGLSRSDASNKLVVNIPFFGRVWHETLPIEDSPAYKREIVNMTDSDLLTFEEVRTVWRSKGKHFFDEETFSPYAIDGQEFLVYENQKSLEAKVAYSKIYRLAGLAIWSVEDDSDENDLLDFLVNRTMATVEAKDDISCEEVKADRWWKFDSPYAGMCGLYAPLINGYYAICNPKDEKFSCCSKHGYCGTGDDFCLGEGNIDYGNNPHLADQEPLKPTKRTVTWHLMTSTAVKQGEPRCGPYAAKLSNGQEATCNPDDAKANCCSPWGYCGTGPDFCECEGCITY